MADAERGTGFCERRSDGTFTVGCISEFFVCSSSFAFVMFCPSGLFFDENVQKCLPRWYASACRGSGNVPLKMAPLAAALASVLPSAEPEESGFCAGRPDGRYNIGCISAYTACMNERAIAMECPSSLVLDEPSGECLDEVSDHVIMSQRVAIVLLLTAALFASIFIIPRVHTSTRIGRCHS
uniref:Chitin-binding type-2 domain-containing protein n=1 Tax=Parascaris equorum TaxID=6256 RepID=A0A914RNG6_PAREQ